MLSRRTRAKIRNFLNTVGSREPTQEVTPKARPLLQALSPNERKKEMAWADAIDRLMLVTETYIAGEKTAEDHKNLLLEIQMYNRAHFEYLRGEYRSNIEAIEWVIKKVLCPGASFDVPEYWKKSYCKKLAPRTVA